MKNLKSIIILFSICGWLSCSDQRSSNEKESEQAPPVVANVEEGVVIGKQLKEDSIKGSLRAYAKGTVGTAEFKITYHSPAVRGRIIWGGLVPFDKVWVTGAHMATTFESSKDFVVGENTLPAGRYGLFTIPGKEQWIFILNKNWQQHLTDEYAQQEDVVRLVVTPQASEHQERLQYEISVTGEDQGSIIMRWDTVQITIPIRM